MSLNKVSLEKNKNDIQMRPRLSKIEIKLKQCKYAKFIKIGHDKSFNFIDIMIACANYTPHNIVFGGIIY